jgi:hypothetical protein
MARTRREEDRLLSADERELVTQAHQPEVKALPDNALADLLQRVRDRRNRARDIAKRQRREMRGRTAPAGVPPAPDNAAWQAKSQMLAAAVKRVNKEMQRRRSAAAREELIANARKALAMRQAAGEPERPGSRSADEGMHSIPNSAIAPSGALDAEGHRPVLERSRKVR